MLNNASKGLMGCLYNVYMKNYENNMMFYSCLKQVAFFNFKIIDSYAYTIIHTV